MTIQQTSYCTFKLKFKNGEVVVNPTSKPKEDIVLYTQKESKDLKYLDEIGEGQLLIDSSGEYEAKDVFIMGEKGKGSDVIAYTVSSENINVGVISFMKDLGEVPVDHFEDSDIILLGAGGGDLFFSPNDANNLIQKLSPKICIVFGFKEQGNNTLASLTELKTEIEAASPQTEKSFKIQEEDIERIEDTLVYYFEV